MNFEYYTVKSGIATPENPEKDIWDWDDFNGWSKNNTLPTINIVDGRYHKDELEKVWQFESIRQKGDWSNISLLDYNDIYAFRTNHPVINTREALQLKSASPFPDRLVKLSEVVKVLEDHAGLEIDSIIMTKIKSL